MTYDDDDNNDDEDDGGNDYHDGDDVCRASLTLVVEAYRAVSSSKQNALTHM